LADFLSAFLVSGSRVLKATAFRVRGSLTAATDQQKAQAERAWPVLFDFFIAPPANLPAIAADLATAKAELIAFTGFGDLDAGPVARLCGEVAESCRRLCTAAGVYEMPEWSLSYIEPRSKGHLVAAVARLAAIVNAQIAAGF
jgi:hypothetical protein